MSATHNRGKVGPVSGCEITEVERRYKITDNRLPFVKAHCLQTEMSIYKMLAASRKLPWSASSPQI